MAKPAKNAISPTRAEDYPEWYQQVVKAADLAENFRRARLHGHQAVGLRDLGEHAAACSTRCSRTPGTRTPTFRSSFR